MAGTTRIILFGSDLLPSVVSTPPQNFWDGQQSNMKKLNMFIGFLLNLNLWHNKAAAQ